MAIRVYQYGLMPPHGNTELVRAELKGGHQYRNQLVAIERARRLAICEFESSAGDIRTLEQTARASEEKLDSALAVVRRERAKTKSRSETAEMKDAVKAAREERKTAKGFLIEARRRLRELDVPPATELAVRAAKAAIEGLKAGSDERANARAAYEMAVRQLVDDPDGGKYAINARAHLARLWARSERTCAWGTGGLIEASHDQVCAMPLYDGVDPNLPRFARFGNALRLGVQLQGGLFFAVACTETDTQLQILDTDMGHVRRYGAKDQRVQKLLKMRIGTNGRLPVWADWLMIYHRPMPPGSVIKWGIVSLRRCGPRELWTIQLVVETNEEVKPQLPGMIALDTGWRVMNKELRVATWVDHEGNEGEVRLSERQIGAIRKASELAGLRADLFNAAREKLMKGLTGSAIPPWLVEATETLDQWRSQARLAALAYRWRDNRFDGDAEVYDALEAWRYKDHHLWCWESSQRDKSLRRRREHYRVFAKGIALKYGTVVLEKFDMRELAKRPATDSDRLAIATVNSNRQLAAVSELNGAIANAVTREGGRVIYVDAIDSTRECNACHEVVQFDAKSLIHNACTACGAVWDQDVNAANNLLERAQQKLAAEGPPGTEVPGAQESKWSKKKRLAAEKRGEQAVAETQMDGSQ